MDLKKINKIIKKIIPGLKDGKCLLQDGLMNLSMNELFFINDALYLTYLTIIIQAYPSNKWEYEGGEDEMFFYVKTLEKLVEQAILQNSKLGNYNYGKNKIIPDEEIKLYREEEE